MKTKISKTLKKIFPLTIRDGLISLAIFVAATATCFLLHFAGTKGEYVSMIYILAVFLISRYTNGYFYGTLGSFLSVLAVNFFFTFPYFYFNFTLSGYPLAICCMLAVAVITGTMTTQIKYQGFLSLEAEREKTRSNLLRAVSHDLRTPLTSILGASSAIAENDDALTKQERLKLLSEINEEALWLIRMVENLLTVTRIDGEHSGAKINKTPEAAEELVAEAVFKFKKRFPEQEVSVKVPPELLMVPMDAMLIEQVIINLLENAVLHSECSKPIELVVAEAAGFAVFEVCDNGRGIDKELLPHIFNGHYRQEYEANGDSRRSMGIGLSVCNTIISAHGGVMTARNRLLGGAVFRFTLPLEAY